MKKCDYPFLLIKEIKLNVFKTAFGYQCHWGGWPIGITQLIPKVNVA